MHIMYIYNLLETDFANKVCMKNNCAYHVRLLENFHSRTINQARDVGGLCMSLEKSSRHYQHAGEPGAEH